jgi:asparagine synthase (glutamine-hydrolysing)
MCGIAGIVVAKGHEPPDLESLLAMAAMIRHRGPDGCGVYRDQRAGLAHTRLSIVDLEGGAQPLANEDETIWVTFNGEIFNHEELRATLRAAGHRFRTRSDTEVIVHAFEEWGEGAWSRFNGQYAFALWEANERRLWLVRDPMGIVPLFVRADEHAVMFASEMKSLFAGGAPAVEIDRHSLHTAFTLWSTPAPRTLFRGVESIEPGQAMCFDECLRRTISTHGVIDFGLASAAIDSLDDAASRLEERLLASIDLRLRADVPVGAYLSGGLDSAVIATLAREVHAGEFRTFSIRFVDSEFDESGAQRVMSRLLRTDHAEIVVGAAEIQDALPRLVWHAESPLLRTAPAPMMLLSALVRREGMKVVLTGEGADELFGGYDIFREDAVRRFWARQPESSARPHLLERVHAHIRADRHGLWRQFFGTGLTRLDDPFYSHRIRWHNTSWATRLLARREDGTIGSVDDDVLRLMPDGWRAWGALERAQTIEIMTFLRSYLLCSQGDRVAMANAVEARYPFLDPNVIRFAQGLPRAMKRRGLHDKIVLRRLGSRRLPEEVWRRPKWPFRAPIGRALFGASAPEFVADLLSPAEIARYGLLNAAAVGALLSRTVSGDGQSSEREQMALMGALTTQMLARQMVDEFPARLAEARGRLKRDFVTVVGRAGDVAPAPRAAGRSVSTVLDREER